MYDHQPVLLDQVLALLRPSSGGLYIDGTVGLGGHSAGILELSAPDGRVLAFDRDPDAISIAGERLAQYGNRITFLQASYAEMGHLAPTNGFDQLDGILLDLGLSSRQLAEGQRGFSFMNDGPLDMRFDPGQRETAGNLVNNLSEAELADIFWQFGEERQSRRFARAIVEQRPFDSTKKLADFIASLVRRRGRIHPATRVFQALRIATNRELDALDEGLRAAIDLLRPGGRLAVISFHSLEDRHVKNTFRRLSEACVCPPGQPVCTCEEVAVLQRVTRKAVKASSEEVEANPRSRSARLRVVEKL